MDGISKWIILVKNRRGVTKVIKGSIDDRHKPNRAKTTCFHPYVYVQARGGFFVGTVGKL